MTSVDGCLQAPDVPDVSNGTTISAQARLIDLVEFVVGKKELLVVGVQDPALVHIASTIIRGAGDDRGAVDALLVGGVVDGEGVLVEGVTDVSSLVLLVGTAVDEASAWL